MCKLKCLIIDDDPSAIDIIGSYLLQMDNVEVTRSENNLQSRKLIHRQQFDIIFLNIGMPLAPTLCFLNSIPEPPLVIIVTADKDHAFEGFEYGIIDYLVKPVSLQRFHTAFGRALTYKRGKDKTVELQSREQQGSLFVKTDGKLVRILIKDIFYIESLKDYIRITTTLGSWLSYQSITTITGKLPEPDFLRIHRSFTVSLRRISKVAGSHVEINGKLIPISRALKQEVLQKIICQGAT